MKTEARVRGSVWAVVAILQGRQKDSLNVDCGMETERKGYGEERR